MIDWLIQFKSTIDIIITLVSDKMWLKFIWVMVFHPRTSRDLLLILEPGEVIKQVGMGNFENFNFWYSEKVEPFCLTNFSSYNKNLFSDKDIPDKLYICSCNCNWNTRKAWTWHTKETLTFGKEERAVSKLPFEHHSSEPAPPNFITKKLFCSEKVKIQDNFPKYIKR